MDDVTQECQQFISCSDHGPEVHGGSGAVCLTGYDVIWCGSSSSSLIVGMLHASCLLISRITAYWTTAGAPHSLSPTPNPF